MGHIMTDTKDTKQADALITEIAHVIWFQERGSTFSDPEELRDAWANEHAEVRKYVVGLLSQLDGRGISVAYSDLDKSLFAKA